MSLKSIHNSFKSGISEFFCDAGTEMKCEMHGTQRPYRPAVWNHYSLQFSVLRKLGSACLDSRGSTKLSRKVGSKRVSAARCSWSEVALCTLQSAAKISYWKMTNQPLQRISATPFPQRIVWGPLLQTILEIFLPFFEHLFNKFS